MARKATVCLVILVGLVICGAWGPPVYGQVTITKVETGDPISATGYDEVFRGVTSVKVRMTVENQTTENLEIDCDPAWTGPRFFQGTTAVDGDYSYVIDPSTTCPIDFDIGWTIRITYWVSAPFPTVHTSGEPIRIEGAVRAYPDGGGPPIDASGTNNPDDWHMFEQVVGTFGDIAASSGEFLVWNVDAVDCGSQFGFAVALGNVTDNCANDSIVGAPRFDLEVGGSPVPNAGAVFVFPNHKGCDCELGLNYAYRLTEPNPEVDADFGRSVAAGDLLWIVPTVPDGYDDVVVGAPNSVQTQGVGEVFVFPSDGSGGFGSAVTVPDPASEGGAMFGRRVAVADLNADGHGDVVVSATRASVQGIDDAGKVYVFYGDGMGGFALADTLQSEHPVDGGDYGFSLAVADADGDQDLDLIVGAPGDNFGYGRVYIYDGLGLSQGLLAELNDPSAQGTGGFGEAVAAGDMTGNGVADLAVGAPWWDAPGLGFADGKLVLVFDPVTSPDYHDFTEPVWERSGLLGNSVAVGDMDGDVQGLADVVVGSPRSSPGSGGDLMDRGEIFVLMNPGGNPTIDTDVRYMFHERQQALPLDGAWFGWSLAAREVEYQEDCTAKWEVIIGEPYGEGASSPPACPGAGEEGSVRVLWFD